jgi:hypothetical protein
MVPTISHFLADFGSPCSQMARALTSDMQPTMLYQNRYLAFAVFCPVSHQTQPFGCVP